jgi:SHS2 domain-containing protein
MSGAGYAFVDDVTSDAHFKAQAASLEELFRTAAEALLAVTLEDPHSVAAKLRESISLEEPSLDLLLLRFLNELVWLRDARGLLLRPTSLTIREAADGVQRLDALLEGEPLERGRHALASEVKAATPHGLRVARSAAGWEAEVTLDV